MRRTPILVLAAVAVLTPLTPVGAQPSPGGTAPTAAPLPTPVLSVRRAPDFLRSRAADEEVAADVADLLARTPAATCVAVTDRGRDVAAANDDLPLIPASLNKLLTTEAAVDLLGAETTLDTVVLADAATGPEGAVTGNLYLVGGGDPLLFTDGFRATLKDEDQTGTDFVRVADAVAAAGISEIRGDVVGDESRYDTERALPTWSSGYQEEGFVGALSALEVNRGRAGLVDDPESPPRTRALGDPPTLGAATLITLLEERGVTVTGTAVAGVAPTTAVEVARVPSVPVADLSAEILTWSDNTAAELVTKELGVLGAGAGTTTAGIGVIQEHLATHGFPMEGVVMTDGSGLDRGNRLTCRLMVDLLDHLGPDSVQASGLSVAGESGTLGARLEGSRLEGRLRAKTGTLADVNALAGFITTDGGTELTFAVIMNDDDAEGYRDADDFALALLDYAPDPPLDAVAPR